MVRLKIFTFLSIFLGINSLFCQEIGHYLKLDGGAGINNLNFKVNRGLSSPNLGNAFNLGYYYFFTPQFGFHTGFGIKIFNNTCKLNYGDTIPTVDIEGKTFDFRIKYDNWIETQTLTALQIPIAFQFKQKLNSKIGINATLGLQVFTPLSSQFQTTGGSITTKGYYKETNVELHSIPAHDFLTSKNSQKGIISNINTSFCTYTALGISIKLIDKVDLYLGGYFEYGLNNSIEEGKLQVYEYNGTYNGLLNSDKVSELKPINYGANIGFIYDLSPKVYTREEMKVMRAKQMQRMQLNKEKQKDAKAKATYKVQKDRDKQKLNRSQQIEKQKANRAKSKK